MGMVNIILYYMTIVATSIIMIKMYEKFSCNKLIFNKRNITYILMFSLLCYFNNLYMFVSIRAITSTILLFITFKTLFKEKISHAIFFTIFISIALIISDVILSIVLPYGIKNIEILNSSLLFKIGLSIISSMIAYFITSNKFSNKFLLKIYKSGFNKKTFYILGFLILIIFNLWMFITCFTMSNKIINLILLISEILTISLIAIILKEKYEVYTNKIKEIQLKQNLELYSKVASEYKDLKHNLMNDLLIIKSKLNKKDQNFINDIINKYKSNYDWVNSITDIPEGLQGLVFLKKNQAEIKKIKFNLEYNIDKKTTNYFNLNNNFKLYEALGIIFDNAIEAAADTKEKIINVVFIYDKHNLIINIMNTFSNNIDLDKIGNKDYSTKNRGSGIGLNYIKKQKNKFKIKQSIINNIFCTEITINKNDKILKKKSSLI